MKANVLKNIFLVLLLAGTGLQFAHPFYLSVTELKYNPSSGRMEGSVRVFLNDLEDALSRLNKTSVDLIKPKDTALTRELLHHYIVNRIAFESEGKQVKYKTLGFEREEEALWIHIETEPFTSPQKLKVKNRILYDYLPTQSNIIHFTMNDRRQSTKISNPDSVVLFITR